MIRVRVHNQSDAYSVVFTPFVEALPYLNSIAELSIAVLRILLYYKTSSVSTELTHV